MEIKELTVKSVTSTDKKKDGTELIGKFGKYFIIRIDTEEEGVVSMFGKQASTLKAGDKISGTVEVKESNGFKNKNFSPLKKEDERIAKLEARVMRLELSFERKFEELTAKIKSDVSMDINGKVQTDADFENYSKPHPMIKDEFEGIDPSDEIPF